MAGWLVGSGLGRRSCVRVSLALPARSRHNPRTMHALTLHNSLTRRREIFAPIDPQRVRLYVPRPDGLRLRPYRQCPAGHRLRRAVPAAAPAVSAHVTYVATSPTSTTRSTRARRSAASPIGEITARTTAEFHADMAALGSLPPTMEPRATDHIAADDRDHRAADRNAATPMRPRAMCCSTSRRDPRLRRAVGPLARRDARRRPRRGGAVQARCRRLRAVEALAGRPSRCRAGTAPGAAAGRAGTSNARRCRWRYLGETFDIHGGGIDLIFPHHENEIAQSCCAFPGSRFAHTWMHNGLLQVGRREDVEEPRQLLHGPGCAGERAGRGDAVAAAARALSRHARLHRAGAGRGAAGTRPVLPRPGRHAPALRRRRRCAEAGAGGAVRRPQYAGWRSRRCMGWPTRAMAGDADGGGRAACRRAGAGPAAGRPGGVVPWR